MNILAPLRRIAVVGVVLVAVHVTSTSSVLAECTSYDEWPSFRALAPRAEQVFVGQVIKGLDYDSADKAIRFVFRVDDVLRGEAERTIQFDPVTSGLPVTHCPDSILRVDVGDVIAFAIDEPSGGAGAPLTTVAFVDGQIDRFGLPGVETITRAELRQLLDLPATDALSRGQAESGQLPVPIWFALGVSALAGVKLSIRIRRRSEASPFRS